MNIIRFLLVIVIFVSGIYISLLLYATYLYLTLLKPFSEADSLPTVTDFPDFKYQPKQVFILCLDILIIVVSFLGAAVSLFQQTGGYGNFTKKKLNIFIYKNLIKKVCALIEVKMRKSIISTKL